MIDWAGGYSSSWRVVKVDPLSWGDIEEVSGIVDINVERDGTDDYPLLETASLSIDLNSVNDEFSEGWYRIEMLARQDDRYERYSIATLLLESGSGNIDKARKTVSIDGYSVLKPAADRLIIRGTYVPKDMNGAEFAADLLRECTPAPVVVDGSFTLNDYYVFSIGTSYIEAVWTLLDTANFVIKIDGDGTIHILPKPKLPELDLSLANARLLQPGVDYELDLSDIPNRYFVYTASDVYVETNSQTDSPTSTVARGRYIDYIDTDPIFINGESIETYAKRRLSELSTVYKKYSYTREFWPDIVPFSAVRASLHFIDLEGDFTVLGQSIRCGKGVTVVEKVGKEIQEYAV